MGARLRRVSAVGEIGEAAGRVASMMMIMARTMKAMGDGVTEVKGAEEAPGTAEETWVMVMIDEIRFFNGDIAHGIESGVTWHRWWFNDNDPIHAAFWSWHEFDLGFCKGVVKQFKVVFEQASLLNTTTEWSGIINWLVCERKNCSNFLRDKS
jgi:hypothetical protein